MIMFWFQLNTCTISLCAQMIFPYSGAQSPGVAEYADGISAEEYPPYNRSEWPE